MTTALDGYDRLEATGLWRETPTSQRVEVVVSVGEATLTITNTRDAVLAHWSLAAVERANKGLRPAIYYPDGDPGETLELGEDAEDMIEAIERLRRVIEKRRPKPGRLRMWSFLVAGLAITGLAVFWLPGALRSHTLGVVPQVKRAEIGADMLAHIARVTGQPCRPAQSRRALDALSVRLTGAPGRLIVLPDGVALTAHLPGGKVLLNRKLFEDWEEPEVVAGYTLAETVRLAAEDPMGPVLDHAGLAASLRLLTTGSLPTEAMQRYAEQVMSDAPIPVDDDRLLEAFNSAEVSTRPYAYAVDVTGESTLPLIEGDPMQGQTPTPLLSDSDWVRLQGICGQ